MENEDIQPVVNELLLENQERRPENPIQSPSVSNSSYQLVEVLQENRLPLVFDEPKYFELLILIYAFDEPIDLLDKTLNGLRLNYKMEIPLSKIGVVIIFDGLERVDESILSDMELLDREASKEINNKKIKLKFNRDQFYPQDLLKKGGCLYQSPREIKFFDDLDKYTLLVEMDTQVEEFICFKYYTGGKNDTMKWFLNGFCKELIPKYIVMLECGAAPEENAISNLLKGLNDSKSMTAVCGYSKLYMQPIVDEHSKRLDVEWYDDLDYVSKMCDKVFSIQEAQNFEKSFEYIFLKPAESIIGCVQSLPTAFCAFHWGNFEKYVPNFLNKENSKEGDERSLNKENSKEKSEEGDDDIFNEYIYGENFIGLHLFLEGKQVKYIPDAVVRLTPCVHLIELLNKRKNTINANFFSVIHLWRKLKYTCSWRAFIVFFIFLFRSLRTMLGFLSLSFYIVYLDIVSSHYFADYSFLNFSNSFTKVNELVMFIYITMLGSLLYYSLNYRAIERPEKFYRASNFLGIFMLISVALGFYVVIKYLINENYLVLFDLTLKVYEPSDAFDKRELRAIVFFNIFTHAVPCFFKFYFTIKDLVPCLHNFIFFFPTFAHNLQIYAFCNIDHIETLESEKYENIKKNEKKQRNYKEFKMRMIFFWIFLNIIVSYVLICLNSQPNFRINFIRVAIYLYTFSFFLISLGSSAYHSYYYVTMRGSISGKEALESRQKRDNSEKEKFYKKKREETEEKEKKKREKEKEKEEKRFPSMGYKELIENDSREKIIELTQLKRN